jgi:hypothetical protein
MMNHRLFFRERAPTSPTNIRFRLVVLPKPKQGMVLITDDVACNFSSHAFDGRVGSVFSKS